MTAANATAARAFEMLTGEDDGRVCADIPDSACREQPRSFFTHVASLGATKTADGLIDPKLVLSWLLTHLGAPGSLIGLLVPIRESGALLPQLFTAGYLRRLPRRKWAWAAASAVQGIAAIGIGLVALTLTGAAAGWSIIGLLAVLAVARSVASVSYKDVLGKTVDRSKRGTATGLATSLSAAGVIAFALTLMLELAPRPALVAGALFAAGGLWLVAAGLFSTLAEEPGATEGGGTPLRVARENLALLREDPDLRRFILTRGLLISTALAPPYMVALASGADGAALEQLGALVLASSLASLTSSYVWGRLADVSSRRVLAFTALAAAITLALTLAADLAGLIGAPLVLPTLIFGLMIAYQGVRLGRNTHLVDMATPERRAVYTALSNTVIGVLLLAGGGFAVVAELAGTATVIALLAAMSALAVPAALRLSEVQQP
jgi:hypothetical protein